MSSSGDTVFTDELAERSRLTAALADLVGPALKRVEISQIMAQSGTAANIGVGRIELGQATIDRISISGMTAGLNAGQTLLEGVRGVLRIRVDFNFSVFGFDRHRRREFRFNFNVGTVVVPQLEDIEVSAPGAVLSDTQVEVRPVDDLDLGGAQFRDLRIDGTDLPAAGFALNGLGLGEVRLSGVEVPATFTDSVLVGSFTPDNPLRLPDTVARNIRLPDIEVPRVSSTAPIHIPDITPTDLSLSMGVDLILLSVNVTVTPVIDLQMASLTINDISAAASIRQIALEDISAPVTLRNLRLGELELHEVTVNQITV